MAEQPEKPVNAGEEVTNPPSSLPLKPEDQFRLINQKLADFSDKLSRVAEPPQFRLADMIQLGVIVIGFIIAIFTAFNLSERISDVRADQAAMERRIIDNMSAAETRISPKLDKLNDLYIAIIERISRLEGAKPQEPK
jgi:hypothetical protein